MFRRGLREKEEGQIESKEGGMREGGRNVLFYNNTSECMHYCERARANGTHARVVRNFVLVYLEQRRTLR